MMNEPILVRDPEKAEHFTGIPSAASTWPTICPNARNGLAIVAKGCDSRNIVVHLQEGQIKREQLVIIGAPCQGMLDRQKVWAKLEGKEPSGVRRIGLPTPGERQGIQRILCPATTSSGQLRRSVSTGTRSSMTNCSGSRCRSRPRWTVMGMFGPWRPWVRRTDGSILMN